MVKIGHRHNIRQPLASRQPTQAKQTKPLAAKPFRKILLATCLLTTSSCGILPTREVSLAERLIPVDKVLTPFDLLFRGEIFAALISIPMIPFTEIGELLSKKSNFPPAFSPDEWKSPYSGPHAGEIYNASEEARQKPKPK